jgi:hypothetical protein
MGAPGDRPQVRAGNPTLVGFACDPAGRCKPGAPAIVIGFADELLRSDSAFSNAAAEDSLAIADYSKAIELDPATLRRLSFEETYADRWCVKHTNVGAMTDYNAALALACFLQKGCQRIGSVQRFVVAPQRACRKAGGHCRARCRGKAVGRGVEDGRLPFAALTTGARPVTSSNSTRWLPHNKGPGGTAGALRQIVK